jgi:hypothetical protein
VNDNLILLGFWPGVWQKLNHRNQLAKTSNGTPTSPKYRYLIVLVFF